MKQNKIVALGMILSVIVPFSLLIYWGFYPFYERQTVAFPPIDFFKLLDTNIGKNSYSKQSVLDKGFLISYNVRAKEDSATNLKKYLTDNDWHYLGLTTQQQDVFCLDPNNSIVFFRLDNQSYIHYAYRIKGNEDCKTLESP